MPKITTNELDDGVYGGQIKLTWDGKMPEKRDIIEAVIADDIRINLASLKRPSALSSHTVHLDGEFDGYAVRLRGKPGSHSFHCEMVETQEKRQAA